MLVQLGGEKNKDYWHIIFFLEISHDNHIITIQRALLAQTSQLENYLHKQAIYHLCGIFTFHGANEHSVQNMYIFGE
jgi:hypothetical protein